MSNVLNVTGLDQNKIAPVVSGLNELLASFQGTILTYVVTTGTLRVLSSTNYIRLSKICTMVQLKR